MKLRRSVADRYPDYELYEPTELFDEANVEAPAGLYARYRKALSEYNHVQYEIANLPELDSEPTQSESDILKEIEKLKAERDKLLADKEETIETLKEFIALHPSLFNSPFRRVHAKIKMIAG